LKSQVHLKNIKNISSCVTDSAKAATQCVRETVAFVVRIIQNTQILVHTILGGQKAQLLCVSASGN